MFVSVIVCTYRRADSLAALLECLSSQSYHSFEILIVDGSGEDVTVAQRVDAIVREKRLEVAFIRSTKGLTRQRNAGLRKAKGDLICFLDDDVTITPRFLEQAVALFEQPDMRDVGGLTGYDVLHYPQTINFRWRLRRILGIVPRLEPGNIDRLGRSIPVSFFQPFSGCKPVGFLYGFCMVYRRAAIADLLFDEELPTYGGEDRDFSFRVGKCWRLILCGDLHLWHHYSPQSRDSGVQRTYQAGFGAGRTFAKQPHRWFDYVTLARFVACEFLVDMLAFLQHPSRDRFLMPYARTRGIITGVRSYQPVQRTSKWSQQSA